jgi:hypothetical protein
LASFFVAFLAAGFFAAAFFAGAFLAAAGFSSVFALAFGAAFFVCSVSMVRKFVLMGMLAF